MTTLSDEQLYAHASRTADRVVLITGAAGGIGKEAALQFASYGAKVVIGDVNLLGARETVEEIRRAGGIASAVYCNVTSWESQEQLFAHAIKAYGSIDVVIVNAGIYEAETFLPANDDNFPSKPNLKTLDVNLYGAVYTTRLAAHYLKKSTSDLKALILIGSMASWIAGPGLATYVASKHAILGLMRGVTPSLQEHRIRTAIIHPWYAETNILPTTVKVALAGVPKTSIPRTAGTIICAATDPDMSTNGAAWTLLDDGPVLRLEQEKLKEGVYGIMDARNKRIAGMISSTQLTIATIRDLLRILSESRISKILSILFVAVALSKTRARDLAGAYFSLSIQWLKTASKNFW